MRDAFALNLKESFLSDAGNRNLIATREVITEAERQIKTCQNWESGSLATGNFPKTKSKKKVAINTNRSARIKGRLDKLKKVWVMKG